MPSTMILPVSVQTGWVNFWSLRILASRVRHTSHHRHLTSLASRHKSELASWAGKLINRVPQVWKSFLMFYVCDRGHTVIGNAASTVIMLCIIAYKGVKDGAFVGNTEHFDNEIDLAGSEGFQSMRSIIVKPQKIFTSSPLARASFKPTRTTSTSSRRHSMGVSQGSIEVAPGKIRGESSSNGSELRCAGFTPLFHGELPSNLSMEQA